MSLKIERVVFVDAVDAVDAVDVVVVIVLVLVNSIKLYINYITIKSFQYYNMQVLTEWFWKLAYSNKINFDSK